jgi:hypothetical protein
MPIQITFDDLPVGYALTPAKPGDMVKVCTTEFCSSEDGDHFIRRLEGIPSNILAKLPPEIGVHPSAVDHLLAVIRQDKTATIYINELKIFGLMQTKRDVKQGELVYSNDIADLKAIRFGDVEIPADAGVVFLFSAGWRKGLFFDLAPIQPQRDGPRTYDLSIALGQFYAYLMFQEFFKISEPSWSRLFSQGWFPFISLRTETVQELVNFANAEWNLDELLNKISAEVKLGLPGWHENWKTVGHFSDHCNTLGVVVERFLASDYISAVSILYPRIEGVMRSYHVAATPNARQTQTGLVDSSLASVDPVLRPHALLLPEKFRAYMTDVYFANFDPKSPRGLSRNTVAHGVAPEDEYSEKAVIIGFLILQQLSFYMAAGAEGSDPAGEWDASQAAHPSP